MRLAISNIAWDVDEDESMAAMLTAHGIDAIDIVPGKYFSREASEAEIVRVRRWWSDRGLAITGMQALLFGTTGLNMFGSMGSRNAMLEHLGTICRTGHVLGATMLVFGSPRNRDRTGLGDDEAQRVAVDFFRRLGDKAASEGVTVCLEPNPSSYGANFMTSSAETAAVVRAVDHPAIRMQLDAGAMTVNGEDPLSVVSSYAGLIGHVHASEPDLAPLGDRGTRHDLLARALNRHRPDVIVSIEMVATYGEPHTASIDRSISVATQAYRDPRARAAS